MRGRTVSSELLARAIEAYTTILLALGIDPGTPGPWTPLRPLLDGSQPKLSALELSDLRRHLAQLVRASLAENSPLTALHCVIAGGSELKLAREPTTRASRT